MGDFRELYYSLLDGASWHAPDNYYLLGDLESYVAAKLRCNVDYTDRMAFAKKQWLNICNAGKFSSDRTIADYAENIWDKKKWSFIYEKENCCSILSCHGDDGRRMFRYGDSSAAGEQRKSDTAGICCGAFEQF